MKILLEINDHETLLMYRELAREDLKNSAVDVSINISTGFDCLLYEPEQGVCRGKLKQISSHYNKVETYKEFIEIIKNDILSKLQRSRISRNLL